MGRKIHDENERIQQKSIGFRNRQMRFMQTNPQFKPDIFCRTIIDEQIKLTGQVEYLESENKE